MGDWRTRKEQTSSSRAGASKRDVLQEVREIQQATPLPQPVSIEDAEFVVIERIVPVQVGKWRMLPPGLEKHRSGWS